MQKEATYSYIDGQFSFRPGDNFFEFITPAFVDLHCHGGGGKYFSEDARTARSLHRASGTGTQLASLVTAPLKTLHSQIEALKELSDIYGIHLEGPYLAHSYCGAHSPQYLRNPDLGEIRDLLAVGEGHILMMTIAPELPGAIAVIEYLVENGVIAAIGHSAANATETRDAIRAGASVVTHINNAMAKVGSPNSLLEVALESNLYLELILDGHHVSESDAKFIAEQAPERIILVTDAMSAAGAPDGKYLIGELEVNVENSVARLSESGKLAGSTLTMLNAFRNAEKLFGFERAVQYSSINPAAALGINLPRTYLGINSQEVSYL